MSYTQNLISGLQRELSLYTELLTLTKAQRGMITAGDVSGLSQLVARSEGVIAEIRSSEVSIVELARGYAAETGAEEDPEAALSALVSSLEGQEMEEYEHLKAAIVDTANGIAKANSMNAVLLQDALAYVEHTIKLIADANGTDTTYGRLGEMNRQVQSAAVDDVV